MARECVQVPLLLSLPRRPDVALALIAMAAALGSTYAAAHILPPLLAILSSRVVGSSGNCPHTRRLLERVVYEHLRAPGSLQSTGCADQIRGSRRVLNV